MKRVLILCVLAVTFQSCALMISGTKQEVTFESNVDGAMVVSNLDTIGITNHAIKIKRSTLTNLYTISKEGCRDTSVVLPMKGNWLVLLDAFLVIPYVTDLVWDVDKRTESIIKVDLDCD